MDQDDDEQIRRNPSWTNEESSKTGIILVDYVVDGNFVAVAAAAAAVALVVVAVVVAAFDTYYY